MKYILYRSFGDLDKAVKKHELVAVETGKNIDDVTKIFKEQIDYEYKQDSDVYFVVYVETCPNGHRTNPNPCWAVYFLY